MTEYTPSQDVRDALKVFLNAARQEAPPVDNSSAAEEEIGSDYRKAMAVLRACAAEEAPQPPRSPAVQPILPRAEPDPAMVKPYKFPALGTVDSAASPDPSQVPDASATSEGERAPSQPIPAPDAPATDLQKDEQPAVVVAPSPSLLTVRQIVVIKNARAGEDYSDTLVVKGARDLELADDGGAGLAFDPTDMRFYGVPSGPGDFELTLTGKIDDRPAEITVKLAVIPDPKSLWTSQPSDESAPFWKPDEDFCLVAGEQLRMIGASKRGRSHAKGGGFREDDFALAVHGPWHIAAVADGAGSARFSRRGSLLAAETASRELPALLDQHLGEVLDGLLASEDPSAHNDIRRRLYDTLVKAAFAAADAIAKEAETLEEPASSLSTTLILVVVRRLGDRWFVAAFSIGDGGAALLDLDRNHVEPLTMPDSGEYAGQTRFLARNEFADPAEVMKRLRFATPERITAIALMSDGITDPKLPTDKIFADPASWSAFWSDDLADQVDFSAPEEEVRAKFLAWLDFWSPGNHDDRTLAVLLPQDR